MLKVAVIGHGVVGSGVSEILINTKKQLSVKTQLLLFFFISVFLRFHSIYHALVFVKHRLCIVVAGEVDFFILTA